MSDVTYAFPESNPAWAKDCEFFRFEVQGLGSYGVRVRGFRVLGFGG